MLRAYFRDLSTAFGQGWTRFWFAPTDPLPLCCLRIIVGAVACYSVLSYSWDLIALFGPRGMVPVGVVEALGSSDFRWSYLDYLPTSGSLWAAHWVGVAVTALFACGVWTRLTGLLSLVVTLAYWHRGPMLTSEMDYVLAFLLLYLNVGPCGDYLSITSRWRRNLPPVRPRFSATLALRLIQVHLAVVYLMMGIGKLSYSDVWWNGEGVWWLIRKPESTWFDWTWLAGHELAVNAWTHAIVAYELAFGVLIWNRWARPLLLLWGVVHWGLLAPLTGMGPFCLLMLAGSLAFVSSPVLSIVLRMRPTEG